MSEDPEPTISDEELCFLRYDLGWSPKELSEEYGIALKDVRKALKLGSVVPEPKRKRGRSKGSKNWTKARKIDASSRIFEKRKMGIPDGFAKDVSFALQSAGMTYSDLAAKLGTHQSQVSVWLSGKRTPRLKTVEEIATILGLDSSVWLADPRFNPGGRSCSQNTASNVLVDRILALSPELLEMVHVFDRYLLASWIKGVPQTVIAKRLGLSQPTISYRCATALEQCENHRDFPGPAWEDLRDAVFDSRRPHRMGGTLKWDDLDESVLLTMYANERHQSESARELGITQGKVRHRWERMRKSLPDGEIKAWMALRSGYHRRLAAAHPVEDLMAVGGPPVIYSGSELFDLAKKVKQNWYEDQTASSL